MEAGKPVGSAEGALPASGGISPQYSPPPPPINAIPQPMPSQMMEEGGGVPSASGSRNPFKDFFSDVNVLDVVFTATVFGVLFYFVDYFKTMKALNKVGYADLSTRVQKIESQLAAAKSKEMNATGGRGTMRRKRALVSL